MLSTEQVQHFKPTGCGSVLKPDSSQDPPIFMFLSPMFISYLLKCNFLVFSFYKRALGVLHRVRKEPPGLH